MKKLICILALLASACASAESNRQEIDNCNTFIGMEADLKLLLTQAFISGMWEGSARGSAVETMAAVLMSDEITARSALVASRTVRLCHARLAVDGRADVYSVMAEVFYDILTEAENGS